MTRTWNIAALAALLALAGAPALAVDGMAVELGSGDSSDMARVGVLWNWDRRWLQGRDWHLGGYWDLALGYWRREPAGTQGSSLSEIGLTPVLRVQRNERAGPYLEAGVGLHYLSRTRVGDKRLSTRFQFGDHVGVGYRFGAKGAWDVAYRFQHLSNASIKRPNDGLNAHVLRLQYHFQ